jgi:hypothetical protein
MKLTSFIVGFIIMIPTFRAISRPLVPDEKHIVNHKVVVEEVIQTTSYTYLHVKENDSLCWLAVPLMQANKGETYYYAGGLPMKEFESKELHRTFSEVIFLGGVSPEPITANKPKMPADDMHSKLGAPGNEQPYKRKATAEVKQNIKIDAPRGCITIGELFANKDAYAGKTVKIKGQVTKYSPEIMNKNWIHLQDGTVGNGKYDLTITSMNTVKTGDVVIMEGKVSLNKDFGYGYLFEVMIEDAVMK